VGLTSKGNALGDLIAEVTERMRLAVRVRAPPRERLHARYLLERSFRELLDDLSSSSLKSG
jgi:hypothetical protein